MIHEHQRRRFNPPDYICVEIAEKTGLSISHIIRIASGLHYNAQVIKMLEPYEVKISVNSKTLEKLKQQKIANRKKRKPYKPRAKKSDDNIAEKTDL